MVFEVESIFFGYQILGLKSKKTSDLDKSSNERLSYQDDQNEDSLTQELHLKQEEEEDNEQLESCQPNLDELVIIGHKMLDAINRIASSAEKIASALENISKK